MDTQKGTMQLSHILDVQFENTETWYANRSDWMVPQNNDPTYGWAGTPTATADKAGTELQSLWTLVGVVRGPQPFAMNAAPSACLSGTQPLAWADYGKDTSKTVSTTSTSESTISVSSDSTIKGGIGELSLDLSYAHGWNSSHGTSKTVSVSQDFQFDPCSEAGTQGIHGWAIFNAPTLVTQWYKLYAYDYDQSSGAGTYPQPGHLCDGAGRSRPANGLLRAEAARQDSRPRRTRRRERSATARVWGRTPTRSPEDTWRG